MPSELYYPSGATSLVIDTYKQGVIASSATNTMWTPASGKAIVLYVIMLNQVGAAGVTYTELYIGASTVFMRVNIPQNAIFTYTFEGGLRVFPINSVLSMKTNSAASSMQYAFYGTEI